MADPDLDFTPVRPDGLSDGAARLWINHLGTLDADEVPTPAETRLLTDAVRAATLADRLADEIDATGGFTITSARGIARPNPLLAELDRARRLTAALLKQLGQGEAATASRENGARRPTR